MTNFWHDRPEESGYYWIDGMDATIIGCVTIEPDDCYIHIPGYARPKRLNDFPGCKFRQIREPMTPSRIERRMHSVVFS